MTTKIKNMNRADSDPDTPSNDSEPRAVISDLHASKTASLVIYRDSGYVDWIRKYASLVDGRKNGTIQNGATKTISLQPGTHTLKMRIDWCSSNSISFDVKSNERVRFRCGSNLHGPRVFLVLFFLLFAPSNYLYLRKTVVGD